MTEFKHQIPSQSACYGAVFLVCGSSEETGADGPPESDVAIPH